MQIGKMFHRGTIQVNTRTNTKGVVADSWATHAERWMNIETQGGREYERAAQQVPEATHVIIMRELSTVTTDMRIVVDGLTLDIESVENLSRRDRIMRLICKETT